MEVFFLCIGEAIFSSNFNTDNNQSIIKKFSQCLPDPVNLTCSKGDLFWDYTLLLFFDLAGTALHSEENITTQILSPTISFQYCSAYFYKWDRKSVFCLNVWG